MIKSLLSIFFLFILPTVYSQVDTVYIEFENNKHLTPNCCYANSYNNIYSVPKIIEDQFKPNGYTFIQPTAQRYNNKITISSFKHEIDTFPTFEFQCYYLFEISKKKYDSINKSCESKKQLSNFKVYKLTETIDSSIIKKIEQERVEPVTGIVDGVFIIKHNDRYFIDTFYMDAFPKIDDSIQKAYSKINKEIIQPKLNELMQPFYISDFEISNKEYREFVKWTWDSIFLHQIYDSIDNENARFILNLSKHQAKKLDPSKKVENLLKYGINYQLKDYATNPLYVKYVLNLYYPQPERFFKRKELNYDLLKYETTKGDTISIYPDTLKVKPSSDFRIKSDNQMYFWHPAFDNYPIHSISYNQALAYCDWKQKKINQTLIKDSLQIEMKIPSLYEYEMAVKNNLIFYGKNEPENCDNSHFTILNRNEEDQFVFLNSKFRGEKTVPSDKIKSKEEFNNLEFIYQYNTWFNANKSFPIQSLNGNVSEFCSTPLSIEIIKYYNIDVTKLDPNKPLSDYNLVLGSNCMMDVIDSEGKQINAIFYKQIIEKTEKTAFYGFRTVMYLKKL